MDEITRFRWQLIAGETIDRAFAEAGIDELLAKVAEAQDEGNGERLEQAQAQAQLDQPEV
jgi:hypothetical protein